MLSSFDSHTMIPAKDLERAKKFYVETLGYHEVEKAHGAFMFAGPNGSRFFLFPSPLAGTAKGALMGWVIADIAAEVGHLKSKGIRFEEYDLPGLKTTDGIASGPSGRSAWFKDSEGNMLGLVQWS